MKLRSYLAMLFGIISMMPVIAIASVYIQNYTGVPIMAYYEYCQSTNNCSQEYNSGWIDYNQAYEIPLKNLNDYVLITRAYSNDGWSYQGTVWSACSILYEEVPPRFANFSKSLVQNYLQCQVANRLNKHSS